MTTIYDNPLALLEDARKLLTDPAKWTQGTAARNAEGEITGTDKPDAVCFCSLGAIWAVGGYFDPNFSKKNASQVIAAEMELHNEVEEFIGYESEDYGIAEFNDNPNTKHDDVLALFDRTIARLREGK